MLLDPTNSYYLPASLVVLVAVAILMGIVIVGGLSEARAARGRPATTGVEGMVGKVGVVREPVGTSLPGWVFVRGERWRAIVAVAPEDAHKQDYEQVIWVGRRVQVVDVRDGQVAVVPFEPSRASKS
jgi:membrane-bound ClpP family serine protease